MPQKSPDALSLAGKSTAATVLVVRALRRYCIVGFLSCSPRHFCLVGDGCQRLGLNWGSRHEVLRLKNSYRLRDMPIVPSFEDYMATEHQDPVRKLEFCWHRTDIFLYTSMH